METLGADEDLLSRLKKDLEKLPPYKTTILGILQEWNNDWEPYSVRKLKEPAFQHKYPNHSLFLRSQI